MKHTKGPWEFDKQYRDDFSEFFRVVDRHGYPVAVTPAYKPGEFVAELESNARLIAAAPELLAMVRYVRGVAKAFPDTFKITEGFAAELDALITKAEGR
jgi:hypothetical protein